MKSGHIAILCALCILLVACSRNPSNETLLQKMSSADNDIKTYSSDVHMTSAIILVANKSTTFSSDTTESTIIDRIDRMMKNSGVLQTESGGYKTSQQLEQYADSGFSYENILGSWHATALAAGSSLMKDKMGSVIALAKSGSGISIIGFETIGGKRYYRVNVAADPQGIVNEAMNDADFIEINVSAHALKNYSLTLWVDQNSYLVAKSAIHAQMSLDDSSSENALDLVYDSVTDYSNINSPSNIEIPQEAKSAALE